MKKISLYVFVILMFSNFGFAQNFTYHCKLDTQFMNKGETIWRNKFINFSFKSTDNKTISIFDHEIEVTYKKKLDEIPDAPDSAVIISGDHNDPPEMMKWTNKLTIKKQLKILRNH